MTSAVGSTPSGFGSFSKPPISFGVSSNTFGDANGKPRLFGGVGTGINNTSTANSSFTQMRK